MTERRTFKRRVRERMTKTGESYTTARSQVTEKRDRNRAQLAAAEDVVSEATLEKETGKRWDQWFSLLDRWGARSKKHSETARFLMEEHEVPGWWAQAVTVGYERARGMRVKYQRPSGFEISASKTVAVPVGALFEAFVDDAERRKWLSGAKMTLRTSQPERSARFDWEDGTTRVVAWFTEKGPSKSTVALAHERLPNADEAETMKAMWKEQLGELKRHLES